LQHDGRQRGRPVETFISFGGSVMRHGVSVGSFLGLLLCGAPLEAQVAETMPPSLSVGARSLSFTMGGTNGATVGFWRMKSDRMNVGWEIGLQAELGGDETDPDVGPGGETRRTDLGISVGPSFRRYIEIGQPVVPFVETGVAVRYGYGRVRDQLKDDSDSAVVRSNHSAGLIGSLGLGLEWFPVERLSVAAHTGVQLNTTYGWSHYSANKSSGWSASFSTFTTGLLLRLYFVPKSPST